MNITIREEKGADIDAIFRVNCDAFPSDLEARLVNTLREQGHADISLVAELEGIIVGHILFSPVTLAEKPELKIAGLAPLAVQPKLQNKGVGSLLIRAGLDQCKTKGYTGAVVLGHPDYYQKFGFLPSVEFGFKSKYDVADEYFMAQEFIADSLTSNEDIVSYLPAFSLA